MLRPLTLAAALLVAGPADAAYTVYSLNQNGGLAGFTAAGGPGVALDFDAVAPGTDIGGQTLNGVTFAATGSPLVVVRAADTFTDPAGYGGLIDPTTNVLPATSGLNVLSPGGARMAAGPDPAVESDGVDLAFAAPVAAFGFDHLSQSADGFSFTTIRVYDGGGNLVLSDTVPVSNVGGIGGGAPGGADFYGVVATGGDVIGRVVITENDNDSQFPDNNIGFDSLRFSPVPPAVPEPASVALVGAGVVGLAGVRRVRRA